jgi:hypothetical protein
MIYLPVLESNFRIIKNRAWTLQDGERFVIKHCVHYEGLQQIKITICKVIDQMEEITMSEKEFKIFVKNLKSYKKPNQ